MADKTVRISRQDYGTSEYNGWKPNTVSGILSSTTDSVNDTIIGYTAAGANKLYIPADFKDHKTVFVFNNTHTADSAVKIHKGDSYQGVNDLTLSLPLGITAVWLDSAKYVDKTTGKIRVSTEVAAAEGKNITLCGYEMR